MTHLRSRRQPAAFTLLEVMVAVALLALIGAMLAQSLSSSMDAKEAVQATSDRYALIRGAMSRMVDELSMAYLSGHQSQTDPRTKTGFLGEAERLSFTAFGHIARTADSKEGDQRQLTYFIDDDPRTHTPSLMRREDVNLDQKFDEGGRRHVLLANVRELVFTYWDPQKEAWAEKWDANGTELNRLPARVRIKMTAVMDGGQEQTFVTQTQLHLTTPLNF